MSRPFGEPVPRKSQRQENVPSHIFTPRSYQVEIVDTAMQRNTIVCLGSSTGKTFITTMLIKGLAHQVRPAFYQGGKRTVYLGNTRENVEHQAGVIARETHLSVGCYATPTGATKWDKDRWNRILTRHQVLALTPRVLLKLFDRNIFSFLNINLVIFDECECAVKDDHPYAAVMKAYVETHTETLPRILGLTASVLSDGITTPGELEIKIKQLESKLNSTAETSTDMIVADLYGAKPKEVVVHCEGYQDQTGMVARIEEILRAGLDFLDNCNMPWGKEGENPEDPKMIPRIVCTECLNILHLLGPWCAGRVAQTFCKQLYKMEDVESDKNHKLLMQMTHTTLQMIHTMVDYDFENVVQCLEDFLLYLSPKVLKLLDTLVEYKPDDNFMIIGGDDSQDIDFGGDASDDSMDLSDEEEENRIPQRDNSRETKPQVHYVAMKRTVTGENGAALEKPADDSLCGIIFVERRHTAFALNKLIQEMCNWNPDLYFIQSCHITGKSNHKPRAGVREAEVVHRKQEEVLRQFRNKEVNLLVSTNVLEEGVDVPRCNLVFRFDAPTDYRSYVQSKGRARAPRSTFYMLVDEPSMDSFTKNLGVFKGIENILLGRCQCQEELREEEVDMTIADQLLPSYVPNADNPTVKVSMSSATLLVNRYCAKLPSDAFTHLTPKCTISQNEKGLYLATLQLPINSPIKKPITGEPMTTKRYAKMAVALKTCEILHQKGELDDNLLPVGKEVIRYEDEEGEWEETEGQARPGTTKRKQYYFKKPADALLGHPQMNQQNYLYTVRMILSCPITEEQNTRGRKIHDPEETARGFGLLSEKQIPLVPCFPVFTRSGEVTTSIDLVSSDMGISENDYQRLKHFHHTVFTHVLRLEKDPMKFDLDNAVTGYIVVPLLRGSEGSYSIDWDFISKVEDAPLNNNRNTDSEEIREPFDFKKEVFEDAVVMPSYRNIDQPQYFYVAEIRQDLNPKSPFPSPELYDTFEHYYASKYSLEITNKDQPLLDVDHTSARLNLLTPRYMNQKGVALPTSSAETRRARRENLQQKQILVPELCDVHPFPASLWRKAVCLPAILYRMNCLLIADEIRMMISRGAHIGVAKLANEFRFPQLEFGFSTKPSDAIQERQTRQESHQEVTNQTKEGSGDDTKQKIANSSSFDVSENSVDKAQSLSGEDVSSECVESSDSETIQTPESESSLFEDKTEASASYPTDHSLSFEREESKVSELSTGLNSLKLDDQESKTTSLVNACIRNIESKEAQTSSLKGDSNENGLEMVECECKTLKTFSKDSQECLNSIDQHNHCHELNSLDTKVVPLDSPLFIDTTLRSSQINASHEETTFHTPCLTPYDLLNGPSSQNSVSSYHTADTSLTPGPSPSHTRHQQLQHTPTNTHPNEESISINGGLTLTQDHQPFNGTPLPNLSLQTNSHLETRLKESIDCDIGSTTVSEKVECLCSRNGTIKRDMYPHHVKQFEPVNQTASTVIDNLLTVSSIPDEVQQSKESQDTANLTNNNENSHHKVENETEKEEQMSSSGIDELEHDEDYNISNFDGTRETESKQEDQLQKIEPKEIHNAIVSAEHVSRPWSGVDEFDCVEGNDICNIDEAKDDESIQEEVVREGECKEMENEETEKSKHVSKPWSGIDEFDCVESSGIYNPEEVREEEVKQEEMFEEVESKEPTNKTDDEIITKDEKEEVSDDGEGTEDEEEDNTEDEKETEDENEEDEDEEEIEPVITFDEEVDLNNFIGPSPCTILQTMTMSNANDFFNLERLETIGDSFLKFAITVYLYCTYPGIHEGKLSYLRSKQVSNYNLYKLGKKKGFPDCMVAAKFEPTENWLPPGFVIKTNNAYRGINVVIASSKNKYGAMEPDSTEKCTEKVKLPGMTPEEQFRAELEEATRPEECEKYGENADGQKTLIPYNLQMQHSLPDKSIADCVEALIGCYLTTCGQRAALQFMSWLGLKVLPELGQDSPGGSQTVLNPASTTTNYNILMTTINRSPQVVSGFGQLQAPSSPLLTHVPNAESVLSHHLDGYAAFEKRIQYTFQDRSYLLQAFTHASYHYNNITDCYQRLEFLGDAILDYVITRHLFEDVKKHSPGILTDLRSALVNNNIFAALAVKWDFHKFFKAISPQLFNVIEKFVARQKEKNDEISLDEEFDMGEETNGQEIEDIEIPKALGDIFESVAGAIYLDSGMSLDTVWRVYYRMMKPQIDMFTAKIPKSPVRELLELEPETAKFEKPERTLDGKIRVMVNVVGKGEFRGIGRNYRIAKSAAAKRALKMIRLMEEQMQAFKYGLPQLPQFTHHHML